MSDPATGGPPPRILLLEDDFYLATDLQQALQAAGIAVSGPFPDEAAALRSLDRLRPDGAFIDINLGGGATFLLAGELARADIPFAFLTGYDATILPPAFRNAQRLEKPYDVGKAAAVVRQWIAAGRISPR